MTRRGAESSDGKLVESALNATGLSPEQLAERMETTKQTVYRWLNGEDPPRGPARVLLRLIARSPEVLEESR